MKDKQQGMVLIFTLLLLFMISLLVFSSLNSSLLQTKVTQSFYDYAIAQNAAESELIVQQAKLQGKNISYAHPNVTVTHHVEIIYADKKETVYRVDTSATYQHSVASNFGFLTIKK